MEALRASLRLDHERAGVPAGAGVAGPPRAGGAHFDLGRVHRLLRALGLGDAWAAAGAGSSASAGAARRAMRLVHVVGSKGKGSTAALLGAVLRAAGVATGEYSSPHVVHFGERVRVGGVPASAAELDALCARHRGTVASAAAAEGGALSFFEAFTALALRHFADERVDVAILEAGLGGVRDATNVAPPDGAGLAASVLTPVHLEHADALGGTLESIARAKAGVARPGVPLVVAPQPYPEVMEVVADEAARAGAPLVRVAEVASWGAAAGGGAGGREVRVRVDAAADSSGVLRGGEGVDISAVRLGARGAYQAANAATAATVACVLRRGGGGGRRAPGTSYDIPDAAIAAGLRESSAALPARFQLLEVFRRGGEAGGSAKGDGEGGAAAAAPAAPAVVPMVLDGAHTAPSGTALGEALREAFPGAPVIVATAMADDKDAPGFAAGLAAALRSDVAGVVVTRAPVGGGSARSMEVRRLADAWRAVLASGGGEGGARGTPVAEVASSVGEALDAALALAGRASRRGRAVVCVTGTFGIAAPTLEWHRARAGA